ncbi:tetratricopeptide repeat protein [Cohnella panacarvi]|uniref:tetratricopeptide repeat protein n=1 Tax=Cohnella panacarvi TaxID=400776 RepID=UPI00047D8365|nr:hypothetical protein [Cohnella panacarvi]
MAGIKSWTRKVSIAALGLAIAGALIQVAPIARAAGAGTAVIQKEPEQAVYVEDLPNGEAIAAALSKFIAKEMKPANQETADWGTVPMMEVSLGGLPTGYTRAFAAFIYTGDEIELLLLAANAKATQFTLLARVSGGTDEGSLFINTSKLNVTYQRDRLNVWSQAPFRAFSSLAVLEWNGKTLRVLSHEYDDPTQRFYDAKRKLIEKKDMKGLLAQEAEGWVEYPGFYQEYYELAGPALLLSYDKALAFYNKDVKTAIRYLDYGLRQYGDTYLIDYAGGKVTIAEIVGEPDAFNPPTIGFDKYVVILNDYAYFLTLAGRNKEAKPILANLIKLVPGRVVAYLNLADAEWSLGQKTAAKGHYKQYWKLLGSKAAKVAPKRVQERMNAKLSQ